MIQLLLTTVLATATSAYRSLPFALSYLGWILAAVAVILVLGLVLLAATRRRTASTRAQPVSRRSSDP